LGKEFKKTAALTQIQLEKAAKIDLGAGSLEGKHVFTFDQSIENNSKKGRNTSNNINTTWRFSQYEYELMGKIGALSRMGSFAKQQLFKQIAEKAVAAYGNSKYLANDKDPNALLPDIPAGKIAQNMAMELGLAPMDDALSTQVNNGLLEIKEELTIGLKLTVSSDGKNEKTKLVLTLGNEKTRKVNAEVVELSFVDFDVLGQFELYNN